MSQGCARLGRRCAQSAARTHSSVGDPRAWLPPGLALLAGEGGSMHAEEGGDGRLMVVVSWVDRLGEGSWVAVLSRPPWGVTQWPWSWVDRLGGWLNGRGLGSCGVHDQKCEGTPQFFHRWEE
eukprot:gene11283-biopygen306